MAKQIRKIIYFDKETIRNILQEQHHGDYTKTVEASSSLQSNGEIESSAKIKLDVPFISRLSFLVSGKIAASYIVKRDSSTTITSTEISEFEKLKSKLIELPNIQLNDIENSSTSFRVAGGYLRIVKGGVEGVDTKEFNAVMDNYDGYDTYAVNENQYVRFNNSAFVSNYKRNDILATTMTLCCIPVGKFERERFDFMKRLSEMEHLISQTNSAQTLADIYPPKKRNTDLEEKNAGNEKPKIEAQEDTIVLFDVVYACINAEVKDD